MAYSNKHNVTLAAQIQPLILRWYVLLRRELMNAVMQSQHFFRGRGSNDFHQGKMRQGS